MADALENHPGGVAAATYLAGRTPADLRPFLRFWDKISYPAWYDLAEALASGPTREIFDLDDELQEVVSAGIEAILAGPAAALGKTFDFSRHRRLLDVGGGTGSWTIAVIERHPHLEATVLELPVVAQMARQRLAAAGLAERVTVVDGDVMAEALPPGHDVVLVANLVHYWSPETNLALLQRARSATESGSHLLLADFWTDPTHTRHSTPPSWPGSSPCTCATETCTASRRYAPGWADPVGDSWNTRPSPVPRA